MSVPQTVQVLAPAKINLALHVTGQRKDGYHLLDSLVGFAASGDTLTVTAPGNGGLSLSGPFARQVPQDRSNFILQMAERAWPDMEMSFHLHKELPVASGIGGGSADAAACYRAIAMLRRIALPDDNTMLLTDERIAALADLGADIPMCVHSEAAHVQGIGEEITLLEDMPALPVVLVNPGVAVSTPIVFKVLKNRQNAPMTLLPKALDASGFVRWLAEQRNDLQEPACDTVPEIKPVLAALAVAQGCVLARMSGSGATCFGVFDSQGAASEAAGALKQHHPEWWVRPTVVNGPSRASPQRMRSTT